MRWPPVSWKTAVTVPDYSTHDFLGRLPEGELPLRRVASANAPEMSFGDAIDSLFEVRTDPDSRVPARKVGNRWTGRHRPDADRHVTCRTEPDSRTPNDDEWHARVRSSGQAGACRISRRHWGRAPRPRAVRTRNRR